MVALQRAPSATFPTITTITSFYSTVHTSAITVVVRFLPKFYAPRGVLPVDRRTNEAQFPVKRFPENWVLLFGLKKSLLRLLTNFVLGKRERVWLVLDLAWISNVHFNTLDQNLVYSIISFQFASYCEKKCSYMYTFARKYSHSLSTGFTTIKVWRLSRIGVHPTYVNCLFIC